MKKVILIAIVLALLPGCNSKPMAECTKEAYGRWSQTRSLLLYGVAIEHFRCGRLTKARTEVLKAVMLDKNSAQARLLLGKIYIEQGKYALAASELQMVHDLVPTSAEVLYIMAVALEKNGRLDEALVSYRRSAELDTTNLDPVLGAAEVLAGQEKVHQARQYLEGYLRAAESEPGFFELAGRLALMEQDYAEAANYYRQALDLDIHNTRYAEALAKAQFFARQYSLAQETLESLRDLPDYTAGGWVHTILGDCYMAMGQPYKAVKAYRANMELNPDKAEAWTNVAKALLASGDPRGAIVAAREALALDRRCLDGTVLLGYALLMDGQVRQSLKVLGGAGKQYDQSAELYCVLGRAHAADGNQADAMRCYAAALRVDPDYRVARELLDVSARDARKIVR